MKKLFTLVLLVLVVMYYSPAAEAGTVPRRPTITNTGSISIISSQGTARILAAITIPRANLAPSA
jgi:hypothetical protein